MANHKDNTKFSVKQVDNRYILEKTINNICYRGSEVNMPIKLYTGTFEDGKINTQKLEEIKIINVEVYDDKNQMNIDDNVGYEKLITDFGDKYAKKYLKKRNLERTSINQKVKYNIEDTVLFKVNGDINLDLLFEKPIIDKVKEIVNSIMDEVIYIDICNTLSLLPVNTVSSNDEIKYFEKKCLLILIDYLIKVFECKILSKFNLPNKYLGLYGIIANDVINKKLSRMAKDKLAIKLYLLILLYANKNVNIESLPRLGYPKTKYLNLLKTIGCTISKNGDVILNLE
ncbi:hypothetical protein EBI_26071 [Enterocytozoon bieneusi H348]|nr:hypothetical protein EBI_26071 [Enterocytozoon bieneusi H348]|eukprot:XP_002649852.1 hypothetical protein EBI_26071 [Enterocytozoon bieneusi H348]